VELMIAPGNAVIQVIFAIAFMVTTGYALGRIHQWYRDSYRREQAYRNGYDLASDSMFEMAMARRPTEATRREEPFEVAVSAPDPGAGNSRRRIVVRQSDYVTRSKAAY
jgi:hypothetical protein